MRGFLVLFFGIGDISVVAGAASGGFALTASHLFQTPECRPSKKVTQKALPRRTAHSLGLGVPSLRNRSGRSGSGWLRCTYTRCVRLRRTVAALPPPDRSRNEARRRGERSRAEAKQKPDQEPDQKIVRSRPEPSAAPTVGSWVSGRNWLAARPLSRAGSLPQKHKQKQSSAAAPLNNERKLE